MVPKVHPSAIYIFSHISEILKVYIYIIFTEFYKISVLELMGAKEEKKLLNFVNQSRKINPKYKVKKKM